MATENPINHADLLSDKTSLPEELTRLLNAITDSLPNYPILFRDGKTFHATLIIEAVESLLNQVIDTQTAQTIFDKLRDYSTKRRYPNGLIRHSLSVEFLDLIDKLRKSIAEDIVTNFKGELETSLGISSKTGELLEKIAAFEQPGFDINYIYAIQSELLPVLEDFPVYPLTFRTGNKSYFANLVNQTVKKLQEMPMSRAAADYVAEVFDRYSFIEQIPEGADSEEPSVAFLDLLEEIKVALSIQLRQADHTDRNKKVMEIDGKLIELMSTLRSKYMVLQSNNLARPNEHEAEIELALAEEDVTHHQPIYELIKDIEQTDAQEDARRAMIREQNIAAGNQPAGEVTDRLPKPGSLDI